MQAVGVEANGVDLPVIKVILNPNLRKSHPDIINGQIKYAPKYAADSPADLVSLMSSRLWKCEFKTSKKPYAKP